MKRIKNYIFLHIILAVYSILGMFSKYASQEPFLSAKFIFYYGIVIFNLALYAILWQQIIKKIPLVTAYANKAVTVIWGLILGFVFFNEVISLRKMIGVILIVFGVLLVIKSDNEVHKKEEIK